jgi:hypothetical protein
MQDYNEWMQIADSQTRGASGHDGEGCLAVFYTRPVLDKKQTELEGRPIYNSVPFCQIRIPGDKNAVVDARVTDIHKRRWPAAWAAYEAKRTGMVDGTPIEHFPLLDVTQVATLKHCGIFSIEQLASVSDGNLKALGPDGMKMRDRAQQHLQGPKQTEKDLRGRIQKLELANNDLQAKLHQLMAAMPSAVDRDLGDEDEDEDEYEPAVATDRMAKARAARAAKRAAA